MRSQGARKKLSATEARNLRTLLLASVFEPQEIGQRLAQARDEAGLTQEEAGDLVGLSTRMVQYHEAGDHVPYRHMRKYAEVYRKPLPWLLHGDDGDLESADAIREALHAELEPFRETLARLEALLRGEEPPPESDDTP